MDTQAIARSWILWSVIAGAIAALLTEVIPVPAIGGVIVGFAQWLLVRKFHHVSTLWILATTIGVAVLGYLMSFAGLLYAPFKVHQLTTMVPGIFIVFSAVGVVGGIATGTLQALVAYRTRALFLRWTYMTMLGFGVAAALLAISNPGYYGLDSLYANPIVHAARSALFWLAASVPESITLGRIASPSRS